MARWVKTHPRAISQHLRVTCTSQIGNTSINSHICTWFWMRCAIGWSPVQQTLVLQKFLLTTTSSNFRLIKITGWHVRIKLYNQ